MFTPEDRDKLRQSLVAAASIDDRITGGALTGSAARDAEDRWSDVDLAFGVAEGVPVESVLDDWTRLMYREHGARHHFDVLAGRWVYRVFLLASTLQVDLALVPASEFGARAPTFRLLFGRAAELPQPPPPAVADLIGSAWLYALHARSCIERGELWRAEYMISGVRDWGLALACRRLGLPAAQGRGLDQLPPAVTAPFQGALVRSLDDAELRRAFAAVTQAALGEIRAAEPKVAAAVEAPMRELAGLS